MFFNVSFFFPNSLDLCIKILLLLKAKRIWYFSEYHKEFWYSQECCHRGTFDFKQLVLRFAKVRFQCVVSRGGPKYTSFLSLCFNMDVCKSINHFCEFLKLNYSLQKDWNNIVIEAINFLYQITKIILFTFIFLLDLVLKSKISRYLMKLTAKYNNLSKTL